MAADKTLDGSYFPRKKIAQLVINADFEIDDGDITIADITEAIRIAVSELKAYGVVYVAKLTLPAIEMDMK